MARHGGHGPRASWACTARSSAWAEAGGKGRAGPGTARRIGRVRRRSDRPFGGGRRWAGRSGAGSPTRWPAAPGSGMLGAARVLSRRAAIQQHVITPARELHVSPATRTARGVPEADGRAYEAGAGRLREAPAPHARAFDLPAGVVAGPRLHRALAHRPCQPRRLGAAFHAGRAEQYPHARSSTRPGPNGRAPRAANPGEPMAAATHSGRRSEPGGPGTPHAVFALHDSHGPAPRVQRKDRDHGHAQRGPLCLPPQIPLPGGSATR
jgi:hypothetical protein